MSDILSARTAPAEQPPVPAHIRDALIRGYGAGLRRIRTMLGHRTHTTARTYTLRREAARLRADIAEIEGLA